jgi:hypothetical protein
MSATSSGAASTRQWVTKWYSFEVGIGLGLHIEKSVRRGRLMFFPAYEPSNPFGCVPQMQKTRRRNPKTAGFRFLKTGWR